MTGFAGSVRRAVLGVPRRMATAFSAGDTPTWRHLESAVLAAVEGYNSAVQGSRLVDLVPRLDRVPRELRGYAYEGAAMGLTAMDCVLPRSARLAEYLAGPGAPHVYMVHIGAGEALARLHRRPEPFIAALPDRVLCWLVMDGYGFHRGFFARRRHVDDQHVPAHLSAYGRRVFDQGVGRSIWFTAGAQVPRIVATIAGFPAHRRADLWLGTGVACAYVGGVDAGALEQLATAAGPYATELAVGASFVAKGRLRAGTPAAHTELACAVLCGGRSGQQAARIVDSAFADLPLDGPEPAYAVLQQRISARFATSRGAVT
jgi:hypothetical protein